MTDTAAIERARKRREATTIPVYDPDTKSLVDVPVGDIGTYEQAGYKTGENASLAMQEDGLTGQIATAMMGVARGGSLGLTDYLVPDSLKNVQQSVEAAHPYIKAGSEIAGSLASVGLAGEAAALTRAGAAAGRIAATTAEGGIRAATDAYKENTELTAERFMQGVGMGFLYGAAGEIAGKILEKAAPLYQKSVNRFLNGQKAKPWIKSNVADIVPPPAVPNVATGGEDLGRGLFDAAKPAAVTPEVGPKYLPDSAFDFAPPTPASGPAPRPTRVSYSYEKRPVVRTPEPDNMVAALEHDRLPMSEAESLEGYNQLDREAADAHRSGMPEVAEDLRSERDYFSKNRGMSDDELAAWQTRRDALKAPWPEFDDAFSRLTQSVPSEMEEQLVRRSVPREMPPQLPKRVAEVVPRSKLPPPRKALSLKTLAARETAPVESLSSDLPEMTPQWNTPQSRAAYELVKPESGYLSHIMSKELPLLSNIGGLGALGQTVLPEVAKLSSTAAATYSGLKAANWGMRRALVGAMNHQAGFNAVMDRVFAPATKYAGKFVRSVLESPADVSTAHLSGNVDADYRAIHDSLHAANATPDAMMDYFTNKYGHVMEQHQQLLSNVVAQASKQAQYVQQQLPLDPRKNVGLMDEPYDPPRSAKLKVIQTFRGVNDPWGMLQDPTVQGIRAMAATHPQTLQEIQRLLMAELADPKVRKNLGPTQLRKISIITGIPATAANSPQFIASLQAQAAANGAPPAPPKQSGGYQNRPNLSASQEKQFASSIATQDQQDQLDHI